METSDEQVHSATIQDNASTEKVDSDHQVLEPDINTNEAAKLDSTIAPTTPMIDIPTIPTADNDALIEKFQAIFKEAASTITKNSDTNTEEIKKSITTTTIVNNIPATPTPTKPVTTIDPITPTTPAAMNPIKLPTHNKDKTIAQRWKKHNKPPLLKEVTNI